MLTDTSKACRYADQPTDPNSDFRLPTSDLQNRTLHFTSIFLAGASILCFMKLYLGTRQALYPRKNWAILEQKEICETQKYRRILEDPTSTAGVRTAVLVLCIVAVVRGRQDSEQRWTKVQRSVSQITSRSGSPLSRSPGIRSRPLAVAYT